MAKLGDPTKIITIEFPDGIDIRMDIGIVREELRARVEVYERLAEVVRLAISGETGKDPKEVIMSFIRSFGINDKIKDIDIRKHKFVLEADSIVVCNRDTKESLINIKVLKAVLSKDILEEYYKKVRAGADTALITSG